MKLTYTKYDAYYLPDLVLPEDTETRPIGMYGLRHGRYLKTNKKAVYTQLLTSGKLMRILPTLTNRHGNGWIC